MDSASIRVHVVVNMQATYNPWLVALSIVVAVMVAYTALMLAARIADASRKIGRIWLLGGGIAMGTGIWSMHFIGMLAFSVPIILQYDAVTTLASWAIAMITSTFALAIGGRERLSLGRLGISGVVMGAGICAMHYSGMAAIRIVPAIQYDPWLVLASVAIAVTASWVALWLAFNLRSGNSRSATLARLGAAVIMGLAISGMHYTAMAASKLVVGSYCIGGHSFNNTWLALTLGLFALGVLCVTLVVTIYDAYLTSRARKHSLRLARVNRDLIQRKRMLTLATRAAGIVCWEFDASTNDMLWCENHTESMINSGLDLSDPKVIVKAMHPDDREVVIDAVKRAQADGQEFYSCRFRVITPNNTLIYMESSGHFYDRANNPNRILGVSRDITRQAVEEQRHRELQAQLREVSHAAGMAEVATGVLHSVGNVLNSLGIAANLVQSKLRNSRTTRVEQVANLLSEQGESLTEFLGSERGRQTLHYLAQLGQHLQLEHQALLAESEAIVKHMHHIRAIVSAQQTHAKRGGVIEHVNLAELLDSAIAIYFTQRTDIVITRDYAAVSPPTLDRHKLLQIVGNLLSNARQALQSPHIERRELAIRLHNVDDTQVRIEVQDSGAGMSADTLKHLFEFGFTTKPDGHGFGLHSSAILAQEMGGELTAASDGLQRGACFTLLLPLARTAAGHERLQGKTSA